jgi:hypothetical protein
MLHKKAICFTSKALCWTGLLLLLISSICLSTVGFAVNFQKRKDLPVNPTFRWVISLNQTTEIYNGTLHGWGQHPRLPKRLELPVIHSSFSHLTHKIYNCVYQTGRVKNSFAHDMLLHRGCRNYISPSGQFPFIA